MLVVLTAAAVHAHRAGGGGGRQTQALHARWQQANQQALLSLSAVHGFSSEERARLQQAGDDPEHTRQVLVQIHEDRLATAAKDLDDAQQRKVELSSEGGYKVYAGQQPRDLVALANQDEWTATAAIAQYAEALRSLRAWKPVSYETFAHNNASTGAAAAQLAQTRTPPAQGPQPQVSGPVLAPRLPQKPDPRVPLAAATGHDPSPDQTAGGKIQSSRLVPEPPTATPQAATVPAPALHAPAAASQDTALSLAETTADVQNEAAIRETLREWAEAMTLNNPGAEAAAYAAHLDRYFLRTDVNHAFVQADKAAYLQRGNCTASFQVQDVHIENLTRSTADVRLVKDVTWGPTAAGTVHKRIRSQLWLAKTDAGWKITGERDFRQTTSPSLASSALNQ